MERAHLCVALALTIVMTMSRTLVCAQQATAVWPPKNLQYSQSGTAAALAQNINGSWSAFSASSPRVTDRGILIEPAVTNECYNFNAKPVDGTGIIISTGNATAIRIVNDKTTLISAGFGPAIASGLMNGNVFEFDYLGHYVTFTLGNTSSTGMYVYSVWAKKMYPYGTSGGIKMGINGNSQETYTNSSTWVRITGIYNVTAPGTTFYVRADQGVVVRFILNQLELVTDYNTGTASNPVITEGAPATHGADTAVFNIPADSTRNTVVITPYNNPIIFRTRPANNQLTVQAVFPEPWYAQYILNVSIIADSDAELPWTSQALFTSTKYFDLWRNSQLDRSNLVRTFYDDFTKFDIATNGHAGTTWYTDPTHATLGNATVASLTYNPGSYSVVNNTLLQCRGEWNATLNKYYTCNLQTANNSGVGFQQAYGVFETRAKIPNVGGAWPAFWPYSIHRYTNATLPHGEWDIFEIYPDNDSSKKQMHCTLNLWNMMDPTVSGGHLDNGHIVTLPYDTTLDYHVYGGEITQDWTIFYQDNLEVTRIRTFREWTAPMYILLGLSLSEGDYGYPLIDFYVDYVGVYQRDASATTSQGGSTGTASTSSTPSSTSQSPSTSGSPSTASPSTTSPSSSAPSSTSPSSSSPSSTSSAPSATTTAPSNSASSFTSFSFYFVIFLILATCV